MHCEWYGNAHLAAVNESLVPCKVGRMNEGGSKEKMFVNKIWFSNDVKNAKNNNRIKNNNPSNGQTQQNQIFALDYVCALFLFFYLH